MLLGVETFRQLVLGVEKHGVGKWSRILHDGAFCFASRRSPQQLRDKWRNVAAPITHAERRMREFVVVVPSNSYKWGSGSPEKVLRLQTSAAVEQLQNETGNEATHEPVVGIGGKPMVFRNRLPRDAALKAATKDDFYSEKAPFDCILRIKERSQQTGVVHVYAASRVKKQPPPIAKFAAQKAVWVATVSKLKTERFSVHGC